MSTDPSEGAHLASIGADLRSALDGVLRAMGLAGSTSKELAATLSLEQTTARRLTRLLTETDPLVAITRAPKPAALMTVVAGARSSDLESPAIEQLRTATRAFEAAITAAGSKAKLTAHVRVLLALGNTASDENSGADVGLPLRGRG